MPTKGKEKSKNILLASRVQSDSDALHVSTLLRSIGFPLEANSILIDRGLFWLTKALRKPSDTVPQLYRKGGMETKALSFFINGLDSRRARSLIDYSLRRCMVSLTQTPQFSAHLHLKYQSIDAILPLFQEALQEPPSPEFQTHSLVTSTPAVEVSIASGLICAIDEAIGVTLCGPEGVCLRYYIEACQYLLSLFAMASPSTASSSSYEHILTELRCLSQIAIPLQYLLGPSQAAITSSSSLSPSPVTSCRLSCPERYWFHLLDLVTLVDKLYNLKYEALEEVLSHGSYSPLEYDSLLSQYNSLLIILFDKREIETMMQMLHHLHSLYFSQPQNTQSQQLPQGLGQGQQKELTKTESLYSGPSSSSLPPSLPPPHLIPVCCAVRVPRDAADDVPEQHLCPQLRTERCP
jgi:hypothetical protein